MQHVPSSPRAAAPVSWEAAQRASLTLQRPGTPPTQYRTPLQSTTHLAQQPSSRSLAAAVATQDAIGEEAGDEEVRKTPMRGEGKRRSSQSYPSDTEAGPAAATAAGATVAAGTVLREGGVRRKPVPSAVMESRRSGGSPASQEFIDNTGSRSSVAQDLDREAGGASPGVDDTPFIRFALDQLTRDEEVRGSRRYPDGSSGDAYAERGDVSPVSSEMRESSVRLVDRVEDDRPNYAGMGAVAAIAATAGGLAAGGMAAHDGDAEGDEAHRPITQLYAPSRPFDDRQRPSRDVPVPRQDEEPNVFISVSNDRGYHQPLDFLPGILRPLWFLVFIFLLLGFLALLLLCAIWSLLHKGIFDYGYFGDAKYFLFEYLPILFGMVIFYWLVQIQVAVYRITPFIAMASESVPKSREEGALLPLSPKTFFWPCFGHFRARQPIVGFFMVICWLQIFTIPLLASAFNVHSAGNGGISNWRWIATAAAIWTVIGLYVILLLAALMLFFWLLSRRRQSASTGVRWDPRSPADLIVLLERSNALSLTENEELRLEAPRLGYWRTSRGGNEVFHSYGIADKSARRYSLENGRIREKVVPPPEPKSRFSDFEDDRDMGREQRHSREKMLPKHLHSADDEAGLTTGGRAVPWFLKPSAALLWAVVAFVLLLAFLILSYLPSTKVSNGFSPEVPAVVSSLGFSGTNFLYSFVPALLAMICFLGILDIDFAYRRLQPYTTLLNENGELAEKSLLLSYTADLPGIVTVKALANGYWRIAVLSLSSLLAITLPIIGGGVFWAEFDIPTQSVRIGAHMPGYYALTVFVALYALTIMVFVFPGKATRDLDRELPRGNRLQSFGDVLRVVRMSRMLDDVAFHAVVSRTDLVTRLLSATPAASGARLPQQQDFATSRVSLADSLRGFGRARQQASRDDGEVPRYALGRYTGRDGKEYVGIDRLRQ